MGMFSFTHADKGCTMATFGFIYLTNEVAKKIGVK